MGNNPVSGVDPDGRWFGKFRANVNAFFTGGTVVEGNSGNWYVTHADGRSKNFGQSGFRGKVDLSAAKTGFEVGFLSTDDIFDIAPDFDPLPQKGGTWLSGMPTIYQVGNSFLVVSTKTGRYVDVMSRSLLMEFETIHRLEKKQHFYYNPLTDHSIGVALKNIMGNVYNPIVGFEMKDIPWVLSFMRPDRTLGDTFENIDNYRSQLQIKRIDWYIRYNLIHNY